MTTPLTRRELEVARLLAKGIGDLGVAASLRISVRTVEGHIRHAYAKTGTGSRSRLMEWVREHDSRITNPETATAAGERTRPVGIDNTTRRMQEDPAEKLALLGETMATGSAGSFIERQEAQGQRQLVASELLPADHGDDAPWLALGFTFGDPAPGDPLFVSATLPEGWEKRATDHSMGSVIVDTLGRERASVFFKAAFYDRRANMHLVGLSWYVAAHVEYDGPLVISDEWATREAVLAAMREHLDAERRRAAEFRGYAADEAGRDPGNRAQCAEHAAEIEKTAAKYEAAIAAMEAGAEQPA